MSNITRLQKMNAPNSADVLFIVKTYKHDPIGFAKEVLKCNLDIWQEAFLSHIAEGKKKIAVSSGNNAGKTYACGMLALWYLTTHPQATVFITANTVSQLHDATMNTIRIIAQNSLITNWFFYSQGKIGLIGSDTMFISAKPNNEFKPESIQGRHAEYFLQIVDEASAISQPVWDALNGNVTTDNSVWVVIGNPTRTETPFHKIWKKELLSWTRMNIDTRDCMYASKSWCADLIAEYGEDSDIVKVRIKGEFPVKGADSFIGMDAINRCYVTKFDQLVYKHEPIVLGIDVGRQGDYSCITVRQGRHIHKILKYHFSDDLMALAEKIRDIYNEFSAQKIVIDVGGMGYGVHDRLKQLITPFNIIGVDNASKSNDIIKWNNKRQENFAIGRALIMEGISFPPDYKTELVEELSAMETYLDNRNRICVERKDEIKKKIGRSPDVSDSLFLALSFKSSFHVNTSKSVYDDDDEDAIFGCAAGGGRGSWLSQ